MCNTFLFFTTHVAFGLHELLGWSYLCGMGNGKKPAASLVYDQHFEAVQEKLDQIQQKLAFQKRAQEQQPGEWKFASDIERVNNQLKAILDNL